MALTRIKTDNILDREVREQDLADGSVTFNKIEIISGGLAGEVLKTDGAGNLFWQTASGAAQNLSSLTDVDVTTNPPLIGDSLAWGGAFWIPQSQTTSGIGLNSLTDVTLSSLTQNEFLRFDGFGWVNDKVSVVYVEGIQPVAITGLIDDLIDVNTAGALVNQHLVFDGSAWRASVVSGIGASSKTFTVADIAARDALTAADGDQSFVRSGATTGEWEMYIWDALAGPAWILIGTQDSASTDAKTIEAIVVPSTISPVLLGNVSPDSRVTIVTIEVTIAFDGAPTLTVGDSGDNARLSRVISGDPPTPDDEGMHDLSSVGTYSTTTDYVYTGSADTDINGYFSAGGATVGSARILVTYV